MLIILSGIGSRSDRESEMRGDGRNKDEGGGGCRKRIGLTALSRRSSRDPLNDPAIRRTAHFYVPMFTLILGGSLLIRRAPPFYWDKVKAISYTYSSARTCSISLFSSFTSNFLSSTSYSKERIFTEIPLY